MDKVIVTNPPREVQSGVGTRIADDVSRRDLLADFRRIHIDQFGCEPSYESHFSVVEQTPAGSRNDHALLCSCKFSPPGKHGTPRCNDLRGFNIDTSISEVRRVARFGYCKREWPEAVPFTLRC